MGTALGFTKVKSARIAHQCSYCGEDINWGEPYVRWFWMEGSDRTACKMHPECWDLWSNSGEEYFNFCDNDRPKPKDALSREGGGR